MGDIRTGQSRGMTFAGYSDLEVEVCTCGVLFAAPEYLLDVCRKTGRSFYCPNGHSLVYESENAKLRKELATVKDSLASERARADQIESSLRATKGVVTRQRKRLERVVKGVCPCCNRYFKDVRRHMETKHPEYAGQA